MYNLRLLNTFLAVAELKHFGLAAERTHATQPGVSQHITRLEKELGLKLFERTKRSVELTDAGKIIYKHAKMIMAMSDKMKDKARRIASGQQGKLTVGLSTSAINSDIPDRIKRYKRQASAVELELYVQSGDKLQRYLEHGEIDVAITTLPMKDSHYERQTISRQAMGIAVLANSPLAQHDSLTLDDVKDQNFIVVPRHDHPRNHDALIARFIELETELKISAYETSFQNILARVAIGEGVGIVALGYQTAGPLVVRVIPLDDPVLSSTPIYSVINTGNTEKTLQHFLMQLSSPATAT